MTEKRVAFCLRGAVSTQTIHYGGPIMEEPKIYINYVGVYKSILKHVVNANPLYKFDFFIQCWNTDLNVNLTNLYKPVASLFEENTKYVSEINAKTTHNKDFAQASQALAIKKVIELKEEYEKEHSFVYDYVIIFRPDIIIWKNMDLSEYKKEIIYVNAHSNKNGDFHFVMSSVNSNYFKNIYDHIDRSHINLMHRFIKYFVENIIRKPFEMDSFVPGKHQDLVRKLTPILLEGLKEFGY